MKRLFLIRHGETEWNAQNRVQGSVDVPLSARGVAQAEALGDFLKAQACTFDRVYSSDLTRARQTAGIIAGRLGVAGPEASPFLREIHCGEWEGHSVALLHTVHQEAYDRWRDSPEVACPGGESVLDVRARVVRFFAEHEAALAPCDNVIVVAHGLINRLFLSVLIGLPAQESRYFLQDNTAVNVFEWGRAKVHVKAWNALPHVEDHPC